MWRVRKIEFVPGLRMYQRWKESVDRVWSGERQVFDVRSQSIQGGESGRSSESACFEFDVQLFEQRGRGPHAEIMADKSQTGQILLRQARNEVFTASISQPETEKFATVRQHQAADRCDRFRSCPVMSALSTSVEGTEQCIHRSLAMSISPKRSLLPPLREVPTEVADAAEETVEKEEEGLW